jgi:hypothetical protein
VVAARRSRLDLLLELAGFVVALAGLAVLARGVMDASPVVFFYTEAEREAMHSGREIMLVGTAILLVAASLLASRGRLLRSLAVMAPALVCTPLAYGAWPGWGWALWLFVPLGVVALSACVPRRPGVGES